MLQPLHSLDLPVHAATLLSVDDTARLHGKGPVFVISTAHELMLHDLRLDPPGRPLLTRLGGGYEMPAGVLLRPGTTTLLVADLHPAEHQFTLYAASLKDADQRRAQPLLRTSGQPLQLAMVGSTLFYADHHRGALMAVDLDTPSTLLPRVALTHLESPLGVSLGADGEQVLVSERRPGRVHSLQPDLITGGSIWQVEREGLHSPRLLSLDEVTGELLVPQFATFGYVQAMDLASGQLRTLLRLASHQRPLAAWRRRDWLLLAETNGIRCWNVHDARDALRRGQAADVPVTRGRYTPAPNP
jgi:hypothetical protein